MEGLTRPDWNPQRQCSASNRAGERCRRNGAPGTLPALCIMHGAGAPQVQRSARMRLIEGADLAVDYLINLLIPRPPCEHCGRSDADRDPVVLRACQLVLDRSGHGPSATIEVEHSAPLTTFSDMSTLELADFAEAQARELRAMADQEATRLLPEAMDAVLLDAFLVPEDDAETGTDASTPEDGQTVLADSTQPLEAVEVLPADAVSGKPWRLGTDGSDTPEDGYGSFPERNKPK